MGDSGDCRRAARQSGCADSLLTCHANAGRGKSPGRHYRTTTAAQFRGVWHTRCITRGCHRCRGGRVPSHASESIRRHTQDLRVQPASRSWAVAGNCNCKNRKTGAKYSHPQGHWLLEARKLCPAVATTECGTGRRPGTAQQRQTPSPRRSTRRLLERFHFWRQVRPARRSAQAIGARMIRTRISSAVALHRRAKQSCATPTRMLVTFFPWRESWSRCR